MPSEINWNCPHCQRAVTLSASRQSDCWHTLEIENAGGRQTLVTTFYVCPNDECRQPTLFAELWASKEDSFVSSEELTSLIKSWDLIPSSSAKQFPDFIPRAIRDDYAEACAIKSLSPKASATLSRRCLQGILRDYWNVKPGRLVDEIEAIKESTDPETWEAIDAVRKLGNIAAHMEKDINLIVEVDPNEAELLTGLIEILLKEWYVARETRRERMNKIVGAARAKR